MKKRTYLFIILILLFSLFIVTVPNSTADESVNSDMILITDAKQYLTYGFKDIYPIYTPEALTSFDMPFIIKKTAMSSLSKQDLNHTVYNSSISFTDRQPKYSYQILEENKDYFLINYHMDIKASTKNFSIDFVPKIKNIEYKEFAWWHSNWSYKKKITLDSTQIPSTLTNFPILINISSDADLAAKVAQAEAADIAFINGAENAQYNHEIELWDSGTGQLVVWVNITSLVHDVDTVLYMYYGNAVCVNQEDVTGTWNSGYTGVWHLNETTGHKLDSTVNSLDSATETLTGQGVTGLAGGADQYDGVDDVVIIPDADVLTSMSAMTIEVFGKHGDTSISNECLVAIYQSGHTTGASYVFYYAGDDITLYIIDNDGDWIGRRDEVDSAPPTDTAWHMFTAVWDGGLADEDITLWLDNVQRDDDSIGGGTFSGDVNDGTDDITFGNRWDSDASALPWYGLLDEIRLSNVVRGADWRTVTYNTLINANDGGFFTLGSEEIPPIPGFNTTSVYPVNNSIGIPLSSVCFATFDSGEDYFMNVSWYFGYTLGNEDILIGTDTNISDGIQYDLLFLAVNRSTTYYWKIVLNDGVGNWENKTYIFTTEGYGGGGGSGGRNVMGIIGLIGILGIIGYFMSNRRRNKDE